MKIHLPFSLRILLLGGSFISITTASETFPLDCPDINWSPATSSYIIHSDMKFFDYGDSQSGVSSISRKPNRINLKNKTFSLSAVENEKKIYSILFESAYNAGERPFEGSAVHLSEGSNFRMENLKNITFQNNFNAYNVNHSSGAIVAMDSSVYFVNNESINFVKNAVGIYVQNGSLTMDYNQSILFKESIFGAINLPLIPGSALSIQYNYFVKFSNNSAASGGAINAIYGPVEISNNGNIEFYHNKSVESTGGGGAMRSSGDTVFQNNKIITFSDNVAEGMGGAIGKGSLSMSNNDAIIFIRNKALSSLSADGGGAIGNNNVTSFSNNQDVKFEQNDTNSLGGAIKSYELTFRENKNIVFKDNTAKISGGAIAALRDFLLFENNDQVSFVNNTAISSGGSVYSSTGSTVFTGNKKLEFSNNNTTQDGGAIYIAGNGNLQIIDNEFVDFSFNSAVDNGGAIRQVTEKEKIFISGNKEIFFTSNSAGKLGAAINFDYSLSITDNKNVVFRGNYVRNQDGIVLNSIYQAERDSSVYGSGKTELAVNRGQIISFYDPVILESKAPVSLNLYTQEGSKTSTIATGTIVLSGEHAGDDLDAILEREGLKPEAEARQRLLDQSRLTSVRGQTTLYGGTFIVKEHAVYQGSNYQADAGSITHIRNGARMNFQKNAFFSSGSTLIVSGNRPVGLSASSISLQGAILEFRLSDVGVMPLLTLNGNIDLSGATFNLLADTGYMTLFSGDYSLLQVNGNLTQTSPITLNLVGLTSKKSELSYNPETKTWIWVSEDISVDKPADPDEPDIAGDPKETPGPQEPSVPETPERPNAINIPSGLTDAAINTLWASSQNLGSFAGLLRNHSIQLVLDEAGYGAAWFDLIGNFYRQRSNDNHVGYDYSAWGAALGGEYQVQPHLQIGAGIGHTFGKNTTMNNLGHIDQDTLMGGAYLNMRLLQQNRHSLWISSAGSFGLARNHGILTSPELFGNDVRGDWNETVWQLDIRFEWSYDMTKSTTLYAFAGFQYATGKQEAFTLNGKYGNYRFSNNSLDCNRLPVGIGILHNMTAWTFIADVSVIPDVSRSNPSVHAQDSSGGGDTVRGINPGRCAFECNLGASYKLTKNWNLTAGYGFSTTGDTVQHNARIGTVYVF